ncbi:hypothetical protein SAMD00019534_114910 [Acytostelium subglobosum LB1]|uniref:hypothetical protein n=1 Tax=Acytostelium subglobosum LB1 TaxID=1410327 RepID=UPI000644A256|nr:hypothetical protein SAMD00019534_114910 [Acytostelium subglobosum LB1]GAM28315.1 hypothetical protein SAMD00019534_114910 [Acytostelium subglobosum LB1]|eukprot:XP_012748632.1 hypothetical protein SAMD00019534_114910 [Acytostelium subglobosum LB1]
MAAATPLSILVSASTSTSTDQFIAKTLDTNLRFQRAKTASNKTLYNDVLTKALKICFEDNSVEKVGALKAVMTEVETVVVTDSPVCGYLLYMLADACRQLTLYTDALNAANHSLKIRETLYGQDSIEVSTCLDLLVGISIAANALDHAVSLFVRSFKCNVFGSYATYAQLSTSIARFKATLLEREQPFLAIKMLAQTSEVLQQQLLQSIQQQQQQQQQQQIDTSALCSTLLGTLLDRADLYDNKLNEYQSTIECYELITTLKGIPSKDVGHAYELIIQTYFKAGRYDQTKDNVAKYLEMATRCFKVNSVDMAMALLYCARLMEEQADRPSPTRLCDQVDALRYYLCTLKIARETPGGIVLRDLPSDTPSATQKTLRDKVETILFNNRPLRLEEVANMVDRMLQITTTEFLLNGQRSQNWLLKYLYPDFIAEDALREKAETLPAKCGPLSKLNGLMKSWKQMWFTLNRESLSYYKSNQDTKPKGELSLLEIKSIEVIVSKEKKMKPQTHCFQLVHPKHTLVLAAETEEQMREWITVLNKAKQYWEEWWSTNLVIEGA